MKLRFLLVLLLASSLSASTRVPPDRWRSDIDFLATQLEKLHPNLYFQTSRATFLAELNDLKNDVDILTDQEISFRLQRALVLIGDAHTRLEIRTEPLTYFPLELLRFGSEWIVVRTNASSRLACGARLVAIDGVGIEDAVARVTTLISHENDQWASFIAPDLLVRNEVLLFLGITAQPGHARFTFESGRTRFDLDLDASPSRFEPLPQTASTPLYQRSSDDLYWWTWDESRRLIYVKYNSCTDNPARTFANFAKEIFAFADRQQVDRFVIDLRNNEGGNSSVINPLLNGLKQRSLKGRLYTIIGRETFSAGVTGALDLRNAGSILVGEPTGGKPNLFGNIRSMTLPASGYIVVYSTQYFHQITNGDPPSLEPDVRIELTAADYFADRDPILDSIAPKRVVASSASVETSRRRAAQQPALPVYQCRD